MSKKLQHCYLYEIVYFDINGMLHSVYGRCWGHKPVNARNHAKRMFRNRFGEVLLIDMIKVGRITSVFHGNIK